MAAQQKVTEQPAAVTEPEQVDAAPVEPEAVTPEVVQPDTAEKTTRARKAKERREAFEVTRPDGVVVVVDRNIDTGEQTVTEK